MVTEAVSSKTRSQTQACPTPIYTLSHSAYQPKAALSHSHRYGEKVRESTYFYVLQFQVQWNGSFFKVGAVISLVFNYFYIGLENANWFIILSL